MDANDKQFALSERSQHLLGALVERYIRDGEPIGSKALVAESGIKVSSATARNIMADLEAQGFLRSPHTSAGRIPTVQGYRLFVDRLLTVQPLQNEMLAGLQSGFGGQLLGDNAGRIDQQELIQQASKLLSEISHLAGIVTTPNRAARQIQQIEFLPLSDARVLAVIVTDDLQVQNRVLHLPKPVERSQLEQASNYLNANFAGHTLAEIRQQLIRQLKTTRAEMDDLMRNTLAFAEQIAEDSTHEDMLVAGQTNLMQCRELNDVDRLRGLFDAFSEKHDLLSLLDSCAESDGVQIFIGNEAGIEVMDDCAMVTAAYHNRDNVVGMLGVIGPTRMAYDRVIPMVDATAKILSAALSQPKE